MKPVRIGCSGWQYADWKQRFYPPRTPQRLWLSSYAERFDTVEVNSTFYRLARRDAVAAWVRDTPEGFVFSIKASRYLTHVKRLEGWLDVLPEGLHTIEFRHQSWFCPEVLDALRARDVALTIGDHPERPFQTHEATASWRFVRFHYGARGRGGNYSATELQMWARRIAQWRRREAVWGYFNNDWRAFAPANAAALKRRLR